MSGLVRKTLSPDTQSNCVGQMNIRSFPSRQLKWISAVDKNNISLLETLQKRMAHFYAASTTYYNDIDFTSEAWKSDACYQDIVSRLVDCHQIVEVGCGAANILRHHPHLVTRYSGCDFSPSLMERNRSAFPGATFSIVNDPRIVPFPDSSADALFSVFVIEHTIYPHVFLSECVRVLKPGGLFILRCPSFLGASAMNSQRAGFSYGNGREKLARGRIFDALITGFDRKIRIPRRCKQIRQQIGDAFAFYVNLAPTCFVDPFAPDHDATYLTYAEEMINYLRGKISFAPELRELNQKWPIYLVGIRE
jgi:SAM-dependent methyltransferase